MLTPRKPATQDHRIEQLLLSEVRPDPLNARKHTKAQIAGIAKSIEAFGYGAPILVDKDGLILSGHGRFEACKKLGLTSVPVVRLAHLSPEQARGLALAENRLAEKSTWDDDVLAGHLKALSAIDLKFDLEATGFTIGEIDFRTAVTKPASKAGEDELPERTSAPPISKLGDVWILGGQHRLACGDATDGDTYERLMGSRRADVVFTDPPYNVSIDGNVSGKGAKSHREFAMASGEMAPGEFTTFLKTFMGHASRYSRTGSVQYVCMDWRHLPEVLTAGQTVFGPMLNLCVWAKRNAGMGSLYRSAHELVTVWKKGSGPHRNNVELGRHQRNRTNVWEYGAFTPFAPGEDTDLTSNHPTPKPVAMIADAILDVTKPQGLVLDPFIGVGSTMIAAQRVGRACMGIEIDPAYVDTCLRRYQRFTGAIVVRLRDGAVFEELEAEAAR